MCLFQPKSHSKTAEGVSIVYAGGHPSDMTGSHSCSDFANKGGLHTVHVTEHWMEQVRHGEDSQSPWSNCSLTHPQPQVWESFLDACSWYHLKGMFTFKSLGLANVILSG